MQPSTRFPAPRRLAIAGLVSAALIATASCGAGERPTAATGPGGSDTASVAKAREDLAKYAGLTQKFPALKPLDGGIGALKGKTVWYVPFGSSVPILNAFGESTGEALSRAGLRFHQCDGKLVPTTVASCLSQAVTQGADAVITGYVDYELVPASFDRLVAKKIPVLLAGSEPSGGKTSSPRLAFQPATGRTHLMQKLAADAIIADSNGKANIVYAASTDSPATQANTAYVKKYVASACSGCTFTQVEYTTAGLDKLTSKVSSALAARRDTNYVLSMFDAALPQTIAGVRAAGMTNKVKISSTTAALDGLQRIKNGDMQFADVGSSPAYTGWTYADSILRQLRGDTPDENPPGVVRMFTRDNVGKLPLTPSAYRTNQWYGSAGYRQSFLDAWNGH